MELINTKNLILEAEVFDRKVIEQRMIDGWIQFIVKV